MCQMCELQENIDNIHKNSKKMSNLINTALGCDREISELDKEQKERIFAIIKKVNDLLNEECSKLKIYGIDQENIAQAVIRYKMFFILVNSIEDFKDQENLKKENKETIWRKEKC